MKIDLETTFKKLAISTSKFRILRNSNHTKKNSYYVKHEKYVI